MAELWQEVQKNMMFIGISLGIIVALGVIARIAEHFLPEKHKVSPARRISIIGVCAAIAAILHMLDFPLLFLAPEFYKLDFSELPVMLCGFYLGPSTAFVGDFANFAVGCALVLPAVIIYHIHKTRRSAFWGLMVGTVILTVFGTAFNAIYLLPKFSQLYGIPLDAIIGMGSAINKKINSVSSFVMLAVAPLNLIKGLSVSVLTLLLYKRVARPLFGRK